MKLTQLKQNRRFLLVLPLLVIPFLCLCFHNFGGGSGEPPAGPKSNLGLNPQLPTPAIDPARAFENKLKAYQQADNDSSRKAQYQRQDPYRRDTPAAAPYVTTHSLTQNHPISPTPAAPKEDRASQLLQQLDRLRQSLHPDPQPPHRPAPLLPPAEIPANPGPDPQLDRLNTMLDKIIRIRNPVDQQPKSASTPIPPIDKIGPADTTANSISANIPEDQTLTSGMTIALRITDSIRVNGRTLPPGQLVYGTATLNNDRLLVHVSSLRVASNLYRVDWEVDDLDGLPGIHIPSLLGRDVAKQSADQGVGSLNLITTDPTLGAQAAGAGIQAAKSFLSHKVRQIRVTVRAGYQVLLHNPREPTHQIPRVPPQTTSMPQPPEYAPEGPSLSTAHNSGVQLMLRDIRIKDSTLWFGLEWTNHSSIVYTPAYARWYIRSRTRMKRTAIQEETLDPLTATPLPVLETDSIRHSWFGFHPFALSKDKQLLLVIGDRSGDRVLTLKIHGDQLLKAKTDVTITIEKKTTEETGFCVLQ